MANNFEIYFTFLGCIISYRCRQSRQHYRKNYRSIVKNQVVIGTTESTTQLPLYKLRWWYHQKPVTSNEYFPNSNREMSVKIWESRVVIWKITVVIWKITIASRKTRCLFFGCETTMCDNRKIYDHHKKGVKYACEPPRMCTVWLFTNRVAAWSRKGLNGGDGGGGGGDN